MGYTEHTCSIIGIVNQQYDLPASFIRKMMHSYIGILWFSPQFSWTMSYDRMYTFDLLTSLQIAMVKSLVKIPCFFYPHLNGFGFGKIYFSIFKKRGACGAALAPYL